MAIHIIKNLLKKKDFKHLENIIHGKNFPWYLNPVVRPKDKLYQFTHVFYYHKINSQFFKDLKPVLDILKPRELLRIKANLLFSTPEIVEHGYHLDYKTRPHQTAILYLNSNNGYTRFRGGKKITSEKNKLVKFDGSLWHTGSSCTNQQHRTVINFNYIL